jgi:hypothetical protein
LKFTWELAYPQLRLRRILQLQLQRFAAARMGRLLYAQGPHGFTWKQDTVVSFSVRTMNSHDLRCT